MSIEEIQNASNGYMSPSRRSLICTVLVGGSNKAYEFDLVAHLL